MSSSIPPEIISDILVRLPVEPLLRFRSVSKPWCALIDSPDFIKRHLNRSITTKSNRSLYLNGPGTLFSLDYTALRTAIPLEVPLKESDEADIVGSCNGLLLLQIQDRPWLQRKDMALFNPATRQYRVLPGTPIEDPNCRCYFDKFGFGYDSVNDDYKVIRVVEFPVPLWRIRTVVVQSSNPTIPGFPRMCNEAKIYSLKTNSWRKVEKFPYCLPHKRVWGVHLNGRLHTVANATSDANSPKIITVANATSDANSPKIIAAFDLVTEKCHYIPLPDGLDNGSFEITVEIFEGMLCVMATYAGGRTDIWLMRVYGVKELWFKLLSINPPLVKPYNTMYALALSRNGREVLLNYDGKRLVWYDLERKSVGKAPFHCLPDHFYVEVCVDSLVPLGGVGKSVGVKKQVKDEKLKEVKVEKTKEVKEEKLEEKKNKKSDVFLSVGFKRKL